MKSIATSWILSAGVLLAPTLVFSSPRQTPNPSPKPASAKSAPGQLKPPPGMMVAPFALPAPKSRGSIRGPVFLPKGAKNVALNSPVTSSVRPFIGGDLPQVVDGVKAGFYGNGVYLVNPNYVGAP